MPAYDFQSRFAALVECGWKRQTIRKVRKGKGQNATPGCTLYLYTGQRTQLVRPLMITKCESVNPIMLDGECVQTLEYPINAQTGKPSTELGYFQLHACEPFVYAEGFNDWDEMMAWFEKTGGLPFDGVLIKW